jgi:formylglycine-generating enzyme required for sulfatase activity
MICPACNSEFLSYSEHCEHCGAPAYLATAAQMADVTHCTYCGARDEHGSNICLTCGLKKAFKASEKLIGTCRNCGIAWRNTWLYCQICGVARENGLVDTTMPLTISAQPQNGSVAASLRRGAYAAATSRHTSPPEPYDLAPSVEDSFLPAPDFEALTELERHTMLSETEVVARMYVNNGDESASPGQSELEQFFRTSEIVTQQPAETMSTTDKPVTTKAGKDNLPTRHEAATIPSPSSTEIGASASPAELSLEAPTTVVPTMPANPTAPVQTVRFLDKPAAPPLNKGLVQIIVILIGLILLFSALIVSGFRLRDLFEPAPQPTVPHPQPSASALPPSAQPIPAPPPGMVYIPGGAFRMGSEEADTYESPVHEVTVAPFFMDRTEVSNEQYVAFLKATNHAAPSDWKDNQYPSDTGQMPVVNVSWQDANDYAAWAGKRLPTEAEWEFAARTTDARRYPWGTKWETAKANTNETGLNRPVEVNAYADAANPFGLLNMAGNVWEWTASEVQSYKDASVLLAPGRIIRGGAFYTPKERATTTYRGFAPPDKQAPGIGFRCVKEVK